MATAKKTKCPPCNCAKKAPRKRATASKKPLSAKAKAARANLAKCSTGCAGTGKGHGNCVKVCMAQKRTGETAFFGVKARKAAKK